MTARTLMTTAAVLALLAGCAGRAPQPVAVSQYQDKDAGCAAIQAELAANTGKIAQLGREKGMKTAQNVAAGVAGLFIWPLWLAMDFQGAASAEQTALEARNAHLARLAADRGC